MLMEKARKVEGVIVLPEGTEERILKAARIITKQKIAKIILLGNEDEVRKKAEMFSLDLSGINIIDPEKYSEIERFIDKIVEIRKHKGLTREKGRILLQNPLYFGGMMVALGEADGMVVGAVTKTSDVMRTALQLIPKAEGVELVSSSFIMVIPDYEFGQRGIYVFGDCAVNRFPDSEELAEIAFQSAKTATDLIDMDAKVAFLTYSTKGSSSDSTTEKVVKAVRKAKEKYPPEKYPRIIFDGEFQLDAAIEPLVAEVKDPGSPIAGKANVLIFPNLEAGNIGYKLVHRFANAEVIGPITQGLSKPVNNLSRGSNISDIINSILVTILQSTMKPIIPTKEIEEDY